MLLITSEKTILGKTKMFEIEDINDINIKPFTATVYHHNLEDGSVEKTKETKYYIKFNNRKIVDVALDDDYALAIKDLILRSLNNKEFSFDLSIYVRFEKFKCVNSKNKTTTRKHIEFTELFRNFVNRNILKEA